MDTVQVGGLRRRIKRSFCMTRETETSPPCGQKQMGCGGGLVMPRIAQMALAEQNTVGSHCLCPVAFTVEERCGIEKSKQTTA